jgi:hypothetical protein
MSVQQLISHLGQCGRLLAELRGRQDYLPLSCAILRAEGAPGMVLCNQPFTRILTDRPFYSEGASLAWGEYYTIAYYPISTEIPEDRIPPALARINAVAGEIMPLLGRLPKPVRDYLHLPEHADWWRVAFHLAWHFPRPFLGATRRRLLAKDDVPYFNADETFVQLHDTGGLSDLLPGLIRSDMGKDLCMCSEAAVQVIIQALERQAQTGTSTPPEAQGLPVVPSEWDGRTPMGLDRLISSACASWTATWTALKKKPRD